MFQFVRNALQKLPKYMCVCASLRVEYFLDNAVLFVTLFASFWFTHCWNVVMDHTGTINFIFLKLIDKGHTNWYESGLNRSRICRSITFAVLLSQFHHLAAHASPSILYSVCSPSIVQFSYSRHRTTEQRSADSIGINNRSMQTQPWHRYRQRP